MVRCFLIFCFLYTSLWAKSTVCLNMIVKNERHVIERCLKSVKPLIDTWVIVDTGSTDGTQEVIREFMRDIPGQLIERPWKHFGYNRSEALWFAKEKADYLLFMDADDWLEYEEDFVLPDLTADAYEILFYTPIMACGRIRLAKASLPWRWEDTLHEYLKLYGQGTSVPLENIKYIIGADGGSYQDPKKYERDARVLEEALKENPNNSRHLFYLAQTYRRLGEWEKAIAAYKRRVAVGDLHEEVYCSLFEIAKMELEHIEDQEVALQSFQLAHQYAPERIEPVYYIAKIHNHAKRYALADAIIEEYRACPTTQRFGSFAIPWIREWGFLFELSICKYYMGDYRASYEACCAIEEVPMPELFLNQNLVNKDFAIKKLQP